MIFGNQQKTVLNLEFLYQKYRKLMYKEAFSILEDAASTEDAIHDTFVKLINNADHVDFEDEAKLRGYILTVCRNTALSMIKKQKRFAKDDISDFEEILPDENHSPDDIIITKETEQIIINCIKNMDTKYQSIFILRKVYNYSFEEIGDLHGISYENAKKRYTRARDKIIESLVKEAE